MATNTSAGAEVSSMAVPPAQLLETFIPGFSLISSFFKMFNIDITVYVSAILLITGMAAALRYVGDTVREYFTEYLVSSAEIRLDDDMYSFVMSFVASQDFTKKSRRFVAQVDASSRFVWHYDEDEDGEEGGEDDMVDFEGDSENAWAALAKKEQRQPLVYTPMMGRHFFRYKGHFMSFNRTEASHHSMWSGTQTPIII
jgi:mitochondrial chaperone BCS1